MCHHIDEVRTHTQSCSKQNLLPLRWCANKSVPAVHLGQDGGSVKLLHQGGAHAHLDGPPATSGNELYTRQNEVSEKSIQVFIVDVGVVKPELVYDVKLDMQRMVLTKCDEGCGWLDSDQPHQHRLRARQCVQQCPHSQPSFVCYWGSIPAIECRHGKVATDGEPNQ